MAGFSIGMLRQHRSVADMGAAFGQVTDAFEADGAPRSESGLAGEDLPQVRLRRKPKNPLAMRASLPVFASRLFSYGHSSTSASSADEEQPKSDTPSPMAGSSGNISTKSAPVTPVGDRLQGGTSSRSERKVEVLHRVKVKDIPIPLPRPNLLRLRNFHSSSAQSSDERSRSERGRGDPRPSLGPCSGGEGQARDRWKRGLRQRGSGTSSGTGTGSGTAASSSPALVPLPSPGPSKARHKKFHRHFDNVAPDERVLNFYSCALVGDILLQGHLYITSNYFAFYSNVFGYVTKLLIPTASVLRVSKEKTARFIPNAIGVATPDDKHVFGSLLSRDNTYKLMVQVWKSALGPGPPAPSLPKELKDDMEDSASGDVLLAEDDDSSLSGSGVDSPVDRKIAAAPLEKKPVAAGASGVMNGSVTSGSGPPSSFASLALPAGPAPSRHTMVLAASTVLLILLFISAAFMLYRISRIQDQFRLIPGDDMYQDLARWQSQLHSRSASQVEEFLNTHLDQLAKVRQSLEALSLLIVSKEDEQNRAKEDHSSHPEGTSSVEHHHSKQHSTKHSKGS